MNTILPGFDVRTIFAVLPNNSVLARELCRFGKHRPAEQLLRAELEVYEAVFGSETGHVDVPALQLGKFLLARGQAAEAQPYFERSLRLCPSAQREPNGLPVAHRLQYIGQCQLALGRIDEAKAKISEALSMVCASWAPKSVGAMQLRLGLAAVLRAQAKAAAAGGNESAAAAHSKEAESLEAIVASSGLIHSSNSWPNNPYA
jgi:tetratricopeptide (TPR) repeat protein